ncbi:MAG: hypothetical protein ACK5A0_00325 [Polaromonas sp.]|jgi:hypothetical protein
MSTMDKILRRTADKKASDVYLPTRALACAQSGQLCLSSFTEITLDVKH